MDFDQYLLGGKAGVADSKRVVAKRQMLGDCFSSVVGEKGMVILIGLANEFHSGRNGRGARVLDLEAEFARIGLAELAQGGRQQEEAESRA